MGGGREPFVCAADTRNPFRFRETWSGPLRDSLFGLAPDGVFRASLLALRAVRSYRTFSPLPTVAAVCNRRTFSGAHRAPLQFRRFDFLWHCPSKSLSTFRPRVSRPNKPGLRGTAPFGVRTFLSRLAPEAVLRPSKTMSNLAAKCRTDKQGLNAIGTLDPRSVFALNRIKRIL